ncbi:MAG: hypothetical protein MR428_00860 [Mesosutterella sp.]|nr:hypothetical protein [Mesosutterella sp.]
MPKPTSATPAQARKTAGRPRVEAELLETNLQVRVTKNLAQSCQELGGAKFMRTLLESAVRRAAALKKLAAAKPAADDAGDPKLLAMTVQCGLHTPAGDYSERTLSLTDYFVKHKESTIIIEARGDSMVDAGIFDGDLLIIDRSIEPRSGDIVLAFLQGDFTLKQLQIVNGKPELHPQNRSGAYPIIRPGEYDDFMIEGVLVGSGRKYRH